MLVTFTNVGSTTWAVPKTIVNNTIEVLVVAGGGAGGGSGGGGGAGGVIYNAAYAVTPGANLTVTVGAGGVGITGGGDGTNGDNSVFGTLTAIGGGGGAGGGDAQAGSGGSGGGQWPVNNQPVGNGTVGQGNNGGQGNNAYYLGVGGGGGGAGGVGVNGSSGGDGGPGLQFSISGTPTYYGGGGGGGLVDGGSAPVAGGIGGGGAGSAGNGEAGTPNTGGGGGGAGNAYPGSGGSGIVIIRYAAMPVIELIAQNILELIGSITTNAGYNYTLNASRPTKSGEVVAHLNAAVFQGDPELVGGDEGKVYYTLHWKVPFSVKVFIIPAESDSTPLDTYGNLIRSDIEQASQIDPYRGGLAIDTRVHPPILYQDAGLEYWVIQTMLEVEYRTQMANPYAQA